MYNYIEYFQKDDFWKVSQILINPGVSDVFRKRQKVESEYTENTLVAHSKLIIMWQKVDSDKLLLNGWRNILDV